MYYRPPRSNLNNQTMGHLYLVILPCYLLTYSEKFSHLYGIQEKRMQKFKLFVHFPMTCVHCGTITNIPLSCRKWDASPPLKKVGVLLNQLKLPDTATTVNYSAMSSPLGGTGKSIYLIFFRNLSIQFRRNSQNRQRSWPSRFY